MAWNWSRGHNAQPRSSLAAILGEQQTTKSKQTTNATQPQESFFMSSIFGQITQIVQSCGAEFDGLTAGRDVFGHCWA
jgi:hypothetical protein